MTLSNLLWIIAAILIIGWLLGVFVWSVNQIVHLLLIVALIILVIKAIEYFTARRGSTTRRW